MDPPPTQCYSFGLSFLARTRREYPVVRIWHQGDRMLRCRRGIQGERCRAAFGGLVISWQCEGSAFFMVPDHDSLLSIFAILDVRM